MTMKLTLEALRVISMKFLLIISMLYKTEWSWELSTWSGKKNLADISTNSPHYFYWKGIRTVNENLNFDIRVWRIKGGIHGFGSRTTKMTSHGSRIINNYWTRLSKISWFVYGEQINYLPKPKAEANNWSARHWQITIFCCNRVQ